jgi:hypothetical protein
MWFVKRGLLPGLLAVSALMIAGFALYRYGYLPRHRTTLDSADREYEVHYVWDRGMKSLRIIREPSGVEEQDNTWRSRVSLEAERIVRGLVAREKFTRAFGSFRLTIRGYEEPYLPDMRDRVRGADDLKDPDETPLMVAVSNGDKSAIQALIRSGAVVNAHDQKGWTALMIAAGSCRDDIVNILLVAGADVNGRNRDGETPLILTAPCHNIRIVRSLLAAGADVNARTRRGYTVLTYTDDCQSPPERDCIKALLKRAGARWQEFEVRGLN